ncbi:MAG: phosphoribosyl-AMP cyclohydrolase [Proteobacteria bacterium]|nr:phosphoribosyl-AMP cyclohydrolase [Pseudomonadota bacterium]
MSTLSSHTDSLFAARGSAQEVEESSALAPKFDSDGLLPCVVTDKNGGAVLMFAYMNADALARTIETGEAHYWSRSRGELWRKGATSGHVQKVIELRIDCDQDALWMTVEQVGAACHVGYQSCFYRSIPVGEAVSAGSPALSFAEAEKVFDPRTVYGKN